MLHEVSPPCPAASLEGTTGPLLPCTTWQHSCFCCHWHGMPAFVSGWDSALCRLCRIWLRGSESSQRCMHAWSRPSRVSQSGLHAQSRGASLRPPACIASHRCACLHMLWAPAEWARGRGGGVGADRSIPGALEAQSARAARQDGVPQAQDGQAGAWPQGRGGCAGRSPERQLLPQSRHPAESRHTRAGEPWLRCSNALQTHPPESRQEENPRKAHAHRC